MRPSIAALDDGRDESKAKLEIARQQTVKHGEFYTLLPPLDDIHYVKTVSDTPSISIHLLANDTACVTRHRFDAASGIVTPFRSGYRNAQMRRANSMRRSCILTSVVAIDEIVVSSSSTSA